MTTTPGHPLNYFTAKQEGSADAQSGLPLDNPYVERRLTGTRAIKGLEDAAQGYADGWHLGIALTDQQVSN